MGKEINLNWNEGENGDTSQIPPHLQMLIAKKGEFEKCPHFPLLN